MAVTPQQSRTACPPGFPPRGALAAFPARKPMRLEIAERKRAQEALRTSEGRGSKLRVQERTSELRKANEDLVAEIAPTEKRSEEELQASASANWPHMARMTMMGELTSSIAHEVNQPPLPPVVTKRRRLSALAWQ